jgi:methionine-gamma-lyase
MDNIKNTGVNTRMVHGGGKKDRLSGALSTPIYQTSTFIFDNVAQGAARFAGEENGYIYTRLGNPNHEVFEEKLALLEGSESAVAASSGMGAIASTLWTLLKTGDHLLASSNIYGCTFSLLNDQLRKFGIETTFVDGRNPLNFKENIRPNTRLVMIETPSNPRLDIIDIKAVAEIVHEHGALLMVDNTFLSPYGQTPIELGADIVVHSATKYLNGHGDVIGGIVAGRKDMISEIRMAGIKDMTGACMSPFDSWLVARGMKTLGVRMDRHCANAMQVAEALEDHPKVSKVYYPGLLSHPQHELAKKQMKCFGGVLSFELKGGRDAGIELMNQVKLCSLAVSLGDTETLIQHPASMTHSVIPFEKRKQMGITEGLVRISVGLEDPEDILKDLFDALNQVKYY